MTESNDVRRRIRRLLSPIPWRIVPRERLYTRTHDRYLLEDVVFPSLRGRPDMQTLLFVGCDTDTAHYPAMFSDRLFITIDIDPGKAAYGAAKHIVDSAANLQAHFAPRSLDAVICNGVVGWGLDRAEDIDRMVEGSFVCLRPAGILIIGWNDTPPWRPPSLDTLAALDRFRELTFPPFPSPVYPTLNSYRHVFNFYEKPQSGGSLSNLPPDGQAGEPSR